MKDADGKIRTYYDAIALSWRAPLREKLVALGLAILAAFAFHTKESELGDPTYRKVFVISGFVAAACLVVGLTLRTIHMMTRPRRQLAQPPSGGLSEAPADDRPGRRR